MTEPMASPTRDGEPVVQEPATQQAPRRMAFEEFHPRCGLVHRRNCCPLPYGSDIGPAFKCGLKGNCNICGEDFVFEGDKDERSTIMAFADMGYVHQACLVNVLQTYNGPTEVPYAQRVERACDALPDHLAEVLRTQTLAQRNRLAAYELTESAPGSGKSLLLIKQAEVYGSRRMLIVAYNGDAAAGMRSRGAYNAHTKHSLGMRANSRGVLSSIRHARAAGEYTALEAPVNLQLTLIENGKSTMLLGHLYPPTVDDGIGARKSLIVKVTGEFVAQLYSSALANGYGLAHPSGRIDSFSDIPLLMALARRDALDTKLLLPPLARLTQGEVARLNAMAATAEGRLAMACALVAPLHEASIYTLSHPTWTPPGGGRLLYVSDPVTNRPFRLPVSSFDEQVCWWLPFFTATAPLRVSRLLPRVALHFFGWPLVAPPGRPCTQIGGSLYLPSIITPCSGVYDLVACDELQDANLARLFFLVRLVQCSDANGGPGHFTRVHCVGDSDQSITGYSGGLTEAFPAFREALFSRIALGEAIVGCSAEQAAPIESTLPVSLRCPRSHIDYANATYDAAWEGYARDAPHQPPAGRAAMQAAPNAIDGVIEFEVNFVSHPLEPRLAALAPHEALAVISRRGLDVEALSPMLLKRAIPHWLKTADRRFTPLEAALRAMRLPPIKRLSTVGELSEELPAEGLPGVLESCTAQCLRVLAAELNPMQPLEALTKHAEVRFSKDKCAQLRLLTAHASKGLTFRSVYICQRQFFPHERNVAEGGLALSQEPRVEYVSLTRATNELLFLQEVDTGGEDADMETTYWEL